MTTRTLLIVGLAAAAAACSGQTLVGTVPDGAPPSDDGGAGLPHSGGTCTPPRDPNDRTFTFPAGVAGTWPGTYQPALGPVRDVPIKLILDQAADGSDQIHLVYGTNPPPAPATSATDYLPGWYDEKIYDGFAYLAHQVLWNGLEVRFALSYFEPWDSWCKLQTSYLQEGLESVTYACIPNYAWDGDSEGDQCTSRSTPPIVLPCQQVQYCASPVCKCDACGCAGSAQASSVQIMSVTFSGDTATIPGGHVTRVAN
jgi:hypothetical protein